MAGWKEAQQEMGLRASDFFTSRATHEPLGEQDTESDTLIMERRCHRGACQQVP